MPENSAHTGTFEFEGQEYVYLSYERGQIPGMPEGLSEAETAVIRLLAARHSNQEIAELREVSPRTVDCQVASIFRRLRVGSRAQLLATLFAPGA